MRSLPWLSIVPAITESPLRLATGVGSPVIIASSIYAASAVIKLSASVTTPSTGIFSPALTSITSPRPIVDKGTSSILSPSISRAVFGCNPIKWRMLLAVLSLAFSSKHLPVSTKVMIITEASKYVCHSMPLAPQTSSPQKVLKILSTKAINVLSATSESIFAVQCFSCFHAEI